jgi:hypothetical protein
MEKPVEICTFELDVILVEKAGKRLPNPMITVAVDSETQVIIGVYFRLANPGVRTALRSFEFPGAPGESRANTQVQYYSVNLFFDLLTTVANKSKL